MNLIIGAVVILSTWTDSQYLVEEFSVLSIRMTRSSRANHLSCCRPWLFRKYVSNLHSGKLACHVQYGIRFVRMLFQLPDGITGWEDEQRDVATFGFALHVIHHW